MPMDLLAWDPAVGHVGSCPLSLIGISVVGTTTPGEGSQALRRCVQEEARTSAPFVITVLVLKSGLCPESHGYSSSVVNYTMAY